MKNWKRYVSFFLSLVMLIGMVPAMPVYADEVEVEEEIEVTEELDVVEEAAEDGESGHVCAKYLEEHLERAATCGEEGRVAYWECDYCGAIYSDEGITILLPEAMGIPATGVHNWGEWFEAEEPAIGVPGLMLRFCVDCDAREEQEIPALEDPEKPEETPVPTEVPVSTPEGTEEPAPDDEDEEFILDPSRDFPEIPENAYVTTYIETEYGFDFYEEDYAEFSAEKDFTPYGELQLSENCLYEVEPSGALTKAVGDVSALAVAALPTASKVWWDESTNGDLNMTFSKNVDLSRVNLIVTIYNNGEFYSGASWRFNNKYNVGETLSVGLGPKIRDGGKFYCTVQLTYRNGSSGAGGIATSNVFDYVQPSAVLSKPNDIHWEDVGAQKLAAWDKVNNAAGYYVHWESQYGNIAGTWWYGDHHTSNNLVTCSIPEENSGMTRFTVEALANLKTHQHSGESDWSDYNMAVINDEKEPVTEYNDDIEYYSERVNENVKVHLDYYDSFFVNSSYDYNHELAQASILLAFSAFNKGTSFTSGSEGSGANAYAFMQKIGCLYDDIKDYGYEEEPTQDSIACVIGSKELESQNNTLIIVGIRGQGYKSEWAGNFVVGNEGDYHQGFEKAADKVLKRLNSYIKDNKISGDITLWISGYSRAAATANIVAGKLDGGYSLPSGVNLAKEDIFAYTFETPAGVKSSVFPWEEKYRNIFNIINSTDLVPKLALEAWNFERYGIDCYLPDFSKTGEINSDLAKKVKRKYEELTGGVYNAPFEEGEIEITTEVRTKANMHKRNQKYLYLRQSLFLDQLLEKASKAIGGQTGYYYFAQDSVKASSLKHESMPSLDVLLNLYISLNLLLKLEPPFIEVVRKYAGKVGFSHYPENCLAMMMTLNGEYEKGYYKYYIIKCPVDVSVTDSSGNVVAMIENDEVTMQDGKDVEVYVDGNGDKYVFILDDSQYELDLTATDDGVMDCTVVDYQRGQGKSSQSVFFDVPLTEGESYTAPFSMTDSSYVLIEESGSSISPDVILSRDEMYNTSVSVTVIGNGEVYGASDSYSVGDTAGLFAEAAENHVFLGWYENGELLSRDENYSFSVKGDTALEAKFISTDVTLTLDREYLAVEQEPGRTEPLSLSIEPAEWEEFLTWSVDADENNQDVISVDEQGTVTVHGPGMAYALATVSFKDYEFTARCRVDVSSEPIGEQLEENFGLNGIQLGTDKATVELYSTNYTELEILPLLQQNIEAMSVGGEKPKDNGAAVSSARFSDPEAAKVFDLIVKDDRTLLIVPKDTNADVAGSYSSAVAATIDGIEFETSAAVSIAVKKSLPKLTASAVTINPFFSDASAELSVSGGEISNIRFDSAKVNPDYVTIEGSTIKLLSGAPDTGSATLNLLADVEGWAMPAAFTAKLTLKYTAPQLKLSATAVTMQDNFEYSRGVELKLMPKNAKQTLSELGVEDLVAPEGYSVDFNDIDGSFVLKATKAPKTETITLKVKIAGTDEKIELNLNVTVTAVALKLKKSSISLASSAPYSIGVGLSVNPADYELQQLNVRITDKAGTRDLTDTKPLNVEYRNGTVYVSATDTTVPGYTYKVWLSAYKGGKETALTVSVLSPEKSAITSTAKASGTIDLSIKGSSITVTPSYKNYELTGDELFGYKVKAMNGKTALGDQSELFDIVKSGNSFVISAKDAENINPKYNYSFVLTTVAANGLQTTAKEVKLSVKESAIKLKLSPSSVNINTTVDDTAVVEVSSALKGYVITTEPIVEIMDKSGKLSAQGQLTVEYSGGKLYIKINENTVAAAYKLLIKAEEGHPAASLTVNILSGTKAAIKATQTVKGSIDVIRPATEITVSAPKFKGYSGTYSQSFKVIAFRGTMELGDYSNQFVITENDDGSAVIRATSAVDHSLKYKLRRELYLPKGDSTVPVPVADAPLQVKMGSAKFTADVKAAQLYELDKNSVGVVTLSSSDRALSGIDRVRIKPAKGSEAFTLKDFGGNQYAIGFADGYARITKGGSVTLEIFLEGNHSAKPNATVSVKLNVK